MRLEASALPGLAMPVRGPENANLQSVGSPVGYITSEWLTEEVHKHTRFENNCVRPSVMLPKIGISAEASAAILEELVAAMSNPGVANVWRETDTILL